MTKNEERLLTDTELELMNIMWGIGEGTVRDVMDHLPKERDLAYTSVSTILRILEKKSVLLSRKSGKSHIYTPIVEKEEYQKRGLQHMVASVFSGAPSQLVKTLLDTEKLGEEELKEIKKLISKRIKS